MSKKIIIDGVIGWDIWGSQIRRELDNTNEEIIVEISSPGGSVFDGIEIFNLLRDYSRNINTVTTKIVGLAASMASYIALSGDRVIAADNAVYMIHNVWGCAIGDHRELQKTANIYEQLSNLLAKAYSKKTAKGIKEIRELMNDETWLYGDEMLEAGFIDEIVDYDQDKKEKKDKNELLMLAKGRFENCIAIMEKSERSKKDLQKAAALLSEYSIDDSNLKNQNNVIKQEKPEITEVKNNMDKKELQEKYPDLYNEVFQDGVKSINMKLENIQAHLEFSDIAPNEVLNAIQNNEEFSPKVHAAKYAKLQLNAELKQKRTEDNIDEIPVKPKNETEDKEDTDAYAAKLKARRGIK